MTAAKKPTTIVRTYRVSSAFTVKFRLRTSAGSIAELSAEWSPCLPGASEFDSLLPTYRSARLEFMRSVARETGMSIAIVEAPND